MDGKVGDSVIEGGGEGRREGEREGTGREGGRRRGRENRMSETLRIDGKLACCYMTDGMKRVTSL